jgi:hypothetical protein
MRQLSKLRKPRAADLCGTHRVTHLRGSLSHAQFKKDETASPERWRLGSVPSDGRVAPIHPAAIRGGDEPSGSSRPRP